MMVANPRDLALSALRDMKMHKRLVYILYCNIMFICSMKPHLFVSVPLLTGLNFEACLFHCRR